MTGYAAAFRPYLHTSINLMFSTDLATARLPRDLSSLLLYISPGRPEEGPPCPLLVAGCTRWPRPVR